MTAAAVEPTEKAEIPFNKQPRDWRKAGVIVAFSAIPVALLVIFTYWPFGSMIGYSFYKMKYIGPRQFVGLQNYIDVFTRPDTLSSLKLSLYYMVGALIQVALALYLSTMLAFKVRGGSAFKAIYFFPYLINGIAVGFIFKFFYTRGYVFDTVLQWCGFQLDNLPYWLKDQSVNNWSLVGASVWRYLGQNVILFIGAMMSIDSTLYERPKSTAPTSGSSSSTSSCRASRPSCAERHPFDHRLAVRLRRPVRHHLRRQRHRHLLRAHGPSRPHQPEGRLGIRHGNRPADHHPHLRAVAEPVLQVRVQGCR